MSLLWSVGFIGASLLNLLSLAGLADSLVEWRCFLSLDAIIATYQALKAYLFGLIPLHIPEWLKDYAVITGSFSVMLSFYGYLTERKSVPEILAETDGIGTPLFAVVLFVVPWLVLIWFVVRHVYWRTHAKRIEPWLESDPEAMREFKHQQGRETRKARVLSSTALGYPFVCLALLFVFSDFAYTMFGASQIAGITFRQECAPGGEIVRITP